MFCTLNINRQELNAIGLLVGTRMVQLLNDGTHNTTKTETFAIYTGIMKKLEQAEAIITLAENAAAHDDTH